MHILIAHSQNERAEMTYSERSAKTVKKAFLHIADFRMSVVTLETGFYGNEIKILLFSR